MQVILGINLDLQLQTRESLNPHEETFLSKPSPYLDLQL